MRQDILDNLDFFSKITQKTLSAFHISGVDSDLYDEINELKQALRSSSLKHIKTIKYNEESDKYTRIFTDGSEDVVSEEEIHSPPTTKNSEIKEKLLKEPSPIVLIRFKIIKQVNDKEITTPAEKLFFNYNNN